MDLTRRISSCKAYIVYLFLLLWVLMKRFFAANANWCRRIRLGTNLLGQHRHTGAASDGKEVDQERGAGSNSIPMPLLDDGQDLEANNGDIVAAPDGSSVPRERSFGCLDAVLCLPLGRRTGTSSPQQSKIVGSSEVTLVATHDDDSRSNLVEGHQEFSKDHVLPLYCTPAPLPLPPPPQLPPPLPPTQTRYTEICFSTSVGAGSRRDSSGSRSTRRPDSAYAFRSQDLYDVLCESTITTTAERLAFIKGLKYTENLDFRFPSLNSTLRVRIPTSKHHEGREKGEKGLGLSSGVLVRNGEDGNDGFRSSVSTTRTLVAEPTFYTTATTATTLRVQDSRPPSPLPSFMLQPPSTSNSTYSSFHSPKEPGLPTTTTPTAAAAVIIVDTNSRSASSRPCSGSRPPSFTILPPSTSDSTYSSYYSSELEPESPSPHPHPDVDIGQPPAPVGSPSIYSPPSAPAEEHGVEQVKRPEGSGEGGAGEVEVEVEDVPITLPNPYPAWRSDPTRAKYVFGSLARGASSAEVILISPALSSNVNTNPNTKGRGGTNGSGARTGGFEKEFGIVVVEEGVLVEIETVAGEGEGARGARGSGGSAGLGSGFARMVMAMGLVPVGFGEAIIGVSQGVGGVMQKNKKAKEEVVTMEMVGEGKVGSVETKPVRRRESVMKDILAWVGRKTSTATGVVVA